MKRTTIVLPDDLAALLERERRRRGVSAAAIVREALDAFLMPPASPLPFVALGRSDHGRLGEDVEEILAREWTYERLMGVPDPRPAERPGDVRNPKGKAPAPENRAVAPAADNESDADSGRATPRLGQAAACMDATVPADPVDTGQEAR